MTDQGYATVASSAVSRTAVPHLLRRQPAVILERIARRWRNMLVLLRKQRSLP